MEQATHKTSKDIQAEKRRATERVKELQAEEASLPARTQEAAQNAAQRRLNGSVGDSEAGSEVSALTQRRGEIPHDVHAAKIHAARLELERVHARKREEQAAADELSEPVELAKDGFEDAKRFYEELKAEKNSHASSNYMLDYDLRRAVDALATVEANAPRM
jgi:chromosome segregation ATPase